MHLPALDLARTGRSFLVRAPTARQPKRVCWINGQQMGLCFCGKKRLALAIARHRYGAILLSCTIELATRKLLNALKAPPASRFGATPTPVTSLIRTATTTVRAARRCWLTIAATLWARK